MSTLVLFVLITLLATSMVTATSSSSLANDLYALGAKYGVTSADKVKLERYLADNPVTDSQAEQIYAKAQEALTQGETELRNWKSDYRSWQYNQWSYENTIWLKNYESALARYEEALDTELAAFQAQQQMEAADRQARYAYEQQQRKEKLAQSLVNSYYNSKKAKSDVYQQYLGLPSLNWW